ncbi:phage tail family protein [Priestia aryabhattai]|uniref:phage tail family protein n=1 Tax=Priestia aryabhattai TaxID=412384 RepID=UPI002E1F9057|nr:phage tail family protein [Priestia aryabhattai]MED4261462.1 phage tail family protein [Priestia aryabhattai]
MDLLIKKQGFTINIADYGLDCLKFRPQSVSHNHKLEQFENLDGANHAGTTFGPRELQASFVVEGDNHVLLNLLTSELHALFATKEPILLIDSRQPGKQWRALVNSVFDIDYDNSSTGTYDLSFLSPRPYCESVGTTLDEFTFDSDVWQAGMNLPSDRDLLYKHKANRFQIYNAGVFLDPCKLPLRILYKGGSSNLTIKNKTTGDIFAYSGTSGPDDTIVLDRIQHFKNDTNIFTYTNHKRISLATGWNDFEINGTSENFEIIFDFRFYYL